MVSHRLLFHIFSVFFANAAAWQKLGETFEKIEIGLFPALRAIGAVFGIVENHAIEKVPADETFQFFYVFPVDSNDGGVGGVRLVVVPLFTQFVIYFIVDEVDVIK